MTKAATFRTAQQVEAFEPAAQRREIPDALLPGFYLVLQPSGARSWAVRYRSQGKPRKLTLGTYPLFQLAEARKLAKAALQAASEGRDPAGERKAAKAANDPADTVEAAFGEYVVRHVRPRNRKSTAAEVERLINRNILPAWKARRIQEVTRRDILQLLDGIVDRGASYSANRTHSTLSAAFNWFVQREILMASPMANVKKPSAEEARDRVLSHSEVKLLWKSCEARGWPFGPLAQLLILTGQRRSEVSAAQWSEFNLDAKEPTWTLPKERSKNGKAHVVPLSPAAVDILRALPRVKNAKGVSRFVFSTNGESHVTGYSKGKANLDEMMLEIALKGAEEGGEDPDKVSISPWRFHDLRRTVASEMARLGINLPVIEKVLNHTSGSFAGIVAVYQHHDFADEKRDALDAWASFLTSLVDDRPSSVVPLRSAQ